MRVLVLQGPNLNMLGTREPTIYGRETLDEIHAGLRETGRRARPRVDTFQSNHEGALIDRLQRRDFDVAVVNAGGLTHTSGRAARRAARRSTGRSSRSTCPTRRRGSRSAT